MLDLGVAEKFKLVVRDAGAGARASGRRAVIDSCAGLVPEGRGGEGGVKDVGERREARRDCEGSVGGHMAEDGVGRRKLSNSILVGGI